MLEDNATPSQSVQSYLDTLLREKVPPENYDLALGPSPYRGLKWFEADAADLIFSRDTQAEAILRDFASTQTLVVVGGSGSGKSSFVRAAVLPRLQTPHAVPGRAGPWYLVTMRPEREPVKRLIDALWSTLFGRIYDGQFYGSEDRQDRLGSYRSTVFGDIQNGDPKQTLRQQISSHTTNFRSEDDDEAPPSLNSVWELFDQFDRAGKGADFRDYDANLLLVVDQFEEIFREGVKPNERMQFFSMIREAYSRPREGVFLILVMRAEDLHRCAEIEGLADLVNSSVFLLDWLRPEDILEAIVEPAKCVLESWDLPYDDSGPTAPFELRVVQELERDVNLLRNHLEQKSDHLPLLQHGLDVLWRAAAERWDREAAAGEQPDFAIRWGDLERALPLPSKKNPERMVSRLQECLNRRSNEVLQEAAKVFASKIYKSFPIGPEKAILAAFCEFASLDENRRLYRKFRTVREIVQNRFTCTTDKENTQAQDALDAALDVFRKANYLSEGQGDENRTFDVTHEAFIRNWDRLSKRINDESKVARVFQEVAEDQDRPNISEQDQLTLIPVFGPRKKRDPTYTPKWADSIYASIAENQLEKEASKTGSTYSRVKKAYRRARWTSFRNRSWLVLLILVLIAGVGVYRSRLAHEELRLKQHLSHAHTWAGELQKSNAQDGIRSEMRAMLLLAAHVANKDFEEEHSAAFLNSPLRWFTSRTPILNTLIGNYAAQRSVTEQNLEDSYRVLMGGEFHAQPFDEIGGESEPVQEMICRSVSEAATELDSESFVELANKAEDAVLVLMPPDDPRNTKFSTVVLYSERYEWPILVQQIQISSKVCWDKELNFVLWGGPNRMPNIFALNWHQTSQGWWGYLRKDLILRNTVRAPLAQAAWTNGYQDNPLILSDEGTGRKAVVFGPPDNAWSISFVDGLLQPMLLSNDNVSTQIPNETPENRLDCRIVKEANHIRRCDLDDNTKIDIEEYDVERNGPHPPGHKYLTLKIWRHHDEKQTRVHVARTQRLAIPHIESIWTHTEDSRIFLRDEAGNHWTIRKVPDDYSARMSNLVTFARQEHAMKQLPAVCLLLSCERYLSRYMAKDQSGE